MDNNCFHGPQIWSLPQRAGRDAASARRAETCLRNPPPGALISKRIIEATYDVGDVMELANHCDGAMGRCVIPNALPRM
jgi:hypothetical protein